MTRVFIVSGVRLYGEGLSQMLSRDGRLDVVGTNSAFAAMPKTDVVLLDTGTTGALEALRELAAQADGPKVVALGLSGSADQVLACAEAGVAGYVCRDSSLDELVHAVECAERGELDCPPEIAAALMDRVGCLAAGGANTDEDTVSLTPRQTQVAQLLEQGLTNQEIGERLHIEVSTVKIHLHNIFEKLGVHYRGQAVARMRGLGILPARVSRTTFD